MSKTPTSEVVAGATEAATQCINTYDQLIAAQKHGLLPVAIIPHYIGVRTASMYGWKVWHLSDPYSWPGPPPDRLFSTFRGEGTAAQIKQRQLEAAKAFVTTGWGYIGEWTRNYMRDYVLAEVNKRFPLRKS